MRLPSGHFVRIPADSFRKKNRRIKIRNFRKKHKLRFAIFATFDSHSKPNKKASVRFRDLEKLYRDSLKSCRIIAKSDEESAIRLRQESSKIPAFPPKKVFNLSAKVSVLLLELGERYCISAT